MPVNESFTGDSLPSGFTLADSSSSDRTIHYTASGAEFDRDENADSGRNYIRTADTDYHTASFTAEITVQAAVGDGEHGNSSQFYFGLGTGGIGKYGVPDRPDAREDTADSVMLIVNASDDDTADRLALGIADDGSWNDDDELLDPYPTSVSTSTHRLRMEYDADNKQIRFSVDFDYSAGPFASDFASGWKDVSSLADSSGWGGGEAASIFFGGDSDDGNLDEPTYAWDFTVVPEPATLTLLTLGGLGALVRRRRW